MDKKSSVTEHYNVVVKFTLDHLDPMCHDIHCLDKYLFEMLS